MGVPRPTLRPRSNGNPNMLRPTRICPGGGIGSSYPICCALWFAFLRSRRCVRPRLKTILGTLDHQALHACNFFLENRRFHSDRNSVFEVGPLTLFVCAIVLQLLRPTRCNRCGCFGWILFTQLLKGLHHSSVHQKQISGNRMGRMARLQEHR